MAVVAALPPGHPVLFVGTEGGMETELLRRSGLQVDCATVEAGALRGRAPWTMVRNLLRILRGTRQAEGLLGSFRADVALVTGGYASVPVALACVRKRIPFLLYLPDIVPGLAVRFLARIATRIATTAEDALRYLPREKVVVTGYPVRPAFFQADRRAARAHFGLPLDETVLLVYGGSRGARSINRAVGIALEPLLSRAVVLHICGRGGDEPWLRERAQELPEALQSRYRLYAYLHEDLPLAFAAADLAVSRAGASTLGELPAAGLPAVLVPYPYVHQEENAEYLVRHGAAVWLPDARLYGADGGPAADALLDVVLPLLEDRERREKMAAAARKLARPDAAQAILGHLFALAGQE